MSRINEISIQNYTTEQLSEQLYLQKYIFYHMLTSYMYTLYNNITQKIGLFNDITQYR